MRFAKIHVYGWWQAVWSWFTIVWRAEACYHQCTIAVAFACTVGKNGLLDTCVFVFSCWPCSAVWCLCVCVCVRVKPEALVLLLVRSVTRGTGNTRYDVHSPLHLTLCSAISETMRNEYCRLGLPQLGAPVNL